MPMYGLIASCEAAAAEAASINTVPDRRSWEYKPSGRMAWGRADSSPSSPKHLNHSDPEDCAMAIARSMLRATDNLCNLSPVKVSEMRRRTRQSLRNLKFGEEATPELYSMQPKADDDGLGIFEIKGISNGDHMEPPKGAEALGRKANAVIARIADKTFAQPSVP